ncbi:hypothetical protein BCR36DRAFT_366372 [Piromyces finnis]|uniref:Uncharacterized protein n=1 Tax=Piromyces finnis TaxID=1754191 RepID=A0A1Y1VL39_9FUNG|nr:hypothetical protein BCR36DRAFT_366372 [Piromyces finnis]|eukprot:ORX59187.1 hypothetical protein BCR36DRAFT_366372 [Piromyces finnis]
MKVIQDITNNIQRLLNISITQSEDQEIDINQESSNIQNNNIKYHDNITKVSINKNKNENDLSSYNLKILSGKNDDFLKSTTSLELKNKIDSIEKEIENSKRKKQSLLENSEYISSKYGKDSKLNSTTATTRYEIKNIESMNSKIGESDNSLASSSGSGGSSSLENEYNYSTSINISKPMIIQIKTETIPQENNKSKIVYHYKIV